QGSLDYGLLCGELRHEAVSEIPAQPQQSVSRPPRDFNGRKHGTTRAFPLDISFRCLRICDISQPAEERSVVRLTGGKKARATVELSVEALLRRSVTEVTGVDEVGKVMEEPLTERRVVGRHDVPPGASQGLFNGGAVAQSKRRVFDQKVHISSRNGAG